MTSGDPKNTRLAGHSAGFTLIEVMGAVAVLGISYVMLATASIQGLQAIGQSQLRIKASLIADQALTELELAAELGQLIEVRTDEYAEDPFVITVDVINMAEFYDGAGTEAESADLIDFLAAEAAGTFAPFRESNWLLGYLREVRIAVVWQERGNEIAVTRTAFIYDQKAFMENEKNSAAEIDPDATAPDTQSSRSSNTRSGPGNSNSTGQDNASETTR
jgi:prepilin-type N-terminal cleavage/methylation domain-containing protein